LIALLTITLVSLALFSLVSFLRLETGAEKAHDSEPVLLVDGLVDRVLNLTYEEILAMPQTTVSAELRCVDNPASTVAKGSWSGVRLGIILQMAGVSPKSIKVAFYAEDDYNTDLPVATATREDIVIACKLNGQPLPERLRLVVPGKWGYKWISRLSHIELVDYDFKGFFESRGYSDEADIPQKP
jgi:DMSO/TMAO reductase YedYZ molybdopterin-dependent catalytic subunit